MRKTITIYGPGGRGLRITARIFSHLAIHKKRMFPGMSNYFYTVTHIPTGLSIAADLTHAQALAFVEEASTWTQWSKVNKRQPLKGLRTRRDNLLQKVLNHG